MREKLRDKIKLFKKEEVTQDTNDDVFNVAYTSDLLIFAIDSKENINARSLPEKSLSILLTRRTVEPFLGEWSLPGGLVDIEETSQESSVRILKKETGLRHVYMQQLAVNDEINRDPRGRTISISYLSLIDKNKVKDILNDNSSWFNINVSEHDNIINIDLNNGKETINFDVEKELIDLRAETYEYIPTDGSKLAFDHEKIIAQGIMGLRSKALKTDVIFNLMPELFTIGELKQVYEVILGKTLVNSAFRRTIADKIILTDNIVKTGGHRPSTLCKYNNKQNNNQ